jgi:hypothetical protein
MFDEALALESVRQHVWSGFHDADDIVEIIDEALSQVKSTSTGFGPASPKSSRESGMPSYAGNLSPIAIDLTKPSRP